MEIHNVKTALKVGTFNISDRPPNLIQIKWQAEASILKDERPRVYLFTSNQIIKKIGGSAAKGGIKSTMGPYLTALQGSPGAVRFVIHHLIHRELVSGKKVELYLINSPRVKAIVNGLFSSYEVEIAGFKEMENMCIEDYFNVEQRYPDWNYQENDEAYPLELGRAHNSFQQQRLGKN